MMKWKPAIEAKLFKSFSSILLRRENGLKMAKLAVIEANEVNLIRMRLISHVSTAILENLAIPHLGVIDRLER